MNDLEAYFNANTGRVINKWSHYFEIYDRHFSKYRNKDIVLLEIGTLHGGSLHMWRHYFGKQARIYGIDINPNCKEAEGENIQVFIGSQADRKFLKEIKNNIPPIDILIDDGGHTMLQQIVTFEELFDHIKPDGVYLCEDMHTSYWTKFGGGLKRHGSFIEYTKNFIDQLNAYNSEQPSFKVSLFTKSVNSLHYYDSLLVIEKRLVPKPIALETGIIKISYDSSRLKGFARIKEKAKYKIKQKLNRFLAYFGLPFQNGDFL